MVTKVKAIDMKSKEWHTQREREILSYPDCMRDGNFLRNNINYYL